MGKSVLILDDSPINTDFLNMFFDEHSVPSIIYHCPAKCLQDISDKKFDISFIDFQMPELTGVQFLEEVFNSGKGNQLGRVFFITADTSFDPKAYSIGNHVEAKLNKPLDVYELEKVLGDFIG